MKHPPTPTASEMLTNASTAKWKNDDILLYHGTFEDYVENILQNVRLPRSSKRGGGWDFGAGFYASFTQDAAMEFSKGKAIRFRDKSPAVIKIKIKRNIFSKLNAIFLHDPNIRFDQSDDYWSYVNYCRASTHVSNTDFFPNTELDPYDVAIGPVAYFDQSSSPMIEVWKLSNGRQQLVRPRLWQVCFKTEAALALLNDREVTEIFRVA